MAKSIWEILGIEATSDTGKIKTAYAERAKEVHPEENPDGFSELRDAYRMAIEISKLHVEIPVFNPQSQEVVIESSVENRERITQDDFEEVPKLNNKIRFKTKINFDRVEVKTHVTFTGMDSREFLKEVVSMVRDHQFWSEMLYSSDFIKFIMNYDDMIYFLDLIINCANNEAFPTTLGAFLIRMSNVYNTHEYRYKLRAVRKKIKALSRHEHMFANEEDASVFEKMKSYLSNLSELKKVIYVILFLMICSYVCLAFL